MTRFTRRRALQSVAAGSATLLAGCTGIGETTTTTTTTTAPPSPPYDDFVGYRTDVGLEPLSNPWFYTERFSGEGTVEGLSRPMWVCVFADELADRGSPTGEQPYRNFELDDGSVEPVPGTEPTNDTYVVLKQEADDAATLRFVARRGEEPARLYFGDSILFDTDEVDPGATFELPQI